MVNSKVATDFDLMIQEGRQRKKNEQLAKEIFGRSKANDTARRKDTRKASGSPSLASRIGITKRPYFNSGTATPRQIPSRPSSAAAQHNRQTRLATEIHNTEQVNLTTTKPNGAGLSIKGSAAPFVIEARNFAPGTSEADIASSVKRDCVGSNGSNSLVSCKIIATKPIVIAELVFNERAVADNVIAKYNNQIADGRTLELRLTRSGPGSLSKVHQETPKAHTNVPPVAPLTPTEDLDAMEDVETDQPDVADNSYNQEREVAERGRRDRDSRREKDEYHSSKHRGDDERRTEQQDRRDEGDRERRRDREYDRDRDREERSTYQRNETVDGSRGSHYGNGIGTTTRPQYGGGYAGGRGSYPGYGGYGGRGGGYRGGYRGYR